MGCLLSPSSARSYRQRALGCMSIKGLSDTWRTHTLYTTTYPSRCLPTDWNPTSALLLSRYAHIIALSYIVRINVDISSIFEWATVTQFEFVRNWFPKLTLTSSGAKSPRSPGVWVRSCPPTRWSFQSIPFLGLMPNRVLTHH